MKEIRLELEYLAYPVWQYQDGEYLNNQLPNDLENESLDQKLRQLQAQYDDLFIGIERNATFMGWNQLENKDDFQARVQEIFEELKEKFGSSYQIVNEIEIY